MTTSYIQPPDFRYYQQEADDAIWTDLQTNHNNKCIVKMFCGTGKSRLMRYCKIAQNQPLVVYVFPSLVLIEQFYRVYLKMDNDQDQILKISSEKEKQTYEREDEYEKPSTTDPQQIRNFIARPHNKIICITYQSFDVLLENLGNTKINVCLFDEGHHAVGETYQKLIFENNFENNNVCEKQIFFTATPKNANGIVMYDRYSKDVGMCGNLVYDYSYLKGVREDYLNPFDIRIDFYTENTNKSVYESIARAILSTGNNRVLTFHTDVNTERDTSVMRFIDEPAFRQAFREIQQAEFPDNHIYNYNNYENIQMIGLSSSTKREERTRILERMNDCPENEIVVISSCETIGEGVDTKNANMCVFVDAKSSYVKIIQNIGRIVRKQNNMSSILIPCWVDKTKYVDCCDDKEKCDEVIRQDMMEGGNFNGILNVMSALKQEDEDIYDMCLNYPDTFSPQEIEYNFKKQGYEILEPVGGEEYGGGIIETVEYLLDDEFYYEGFEDDFENEEEMLLSIAEEHNVRIEIYGVSLENPVETYGGEPGDVGEDDEDIGVIRIYKREPDEEDRDVVYCPIVKTAGKTKKNADVVQPPKNTEGRRAFHLNIHENPEMKVLWKIVGDISKEVGSCVLECEVVVVDWDEKLVEVKLWMDEHKKRPSGISKDKTEKRLMNWSDNQNQNHKNNKMKSERREQWEKFIEEYKEYFKTNEEIWDDNFEELKEFIGKNKKRPSGDSKDATEKRIKGWLGSQLKNYKNKINSMKTPERQKQWEQFIEEYKEYLKTNQEIWDDNFEELKIFIDKNKKRPSRTLNGATEKRIGSWLSTQTKNYNNNSMKPHERQQIWEQFIEEYKEYLKTNQEIWDDNFEELKIFIDKNKKRPSQGSKDTFEKQLGGWLNCQLIKYKKKINSMKDTERQQIWEQFIEEYGEYLKTVDEIWDDNFEELKGFIDKNKKQPSTISKDATEKQIGQWLSHQLTNYKNKIKGMKDPERQQIWEQFIEEYGEYLKTVDGIWDNNFVELKEFIDKNKKRPSDYSKNNTEKRISSWLFHQLENYKKKTNSMKDTERQQIWEQFIEEYGKYFKSEDEIWNENLEELKKFIDKNKKRPTSSPKTDTTEKRIGIWLSCQMTNYKNRTKGMKDPERRQQWTTFKNEYSQYFNDDDEDTQQEEPEETKEQEHPPVSTTPNTPTKSMKLKIKVKKTQEKETPQQTHARAKAEISVLHQRYKTLNSANLHQEFAQTPALWTRYHEIAEKNETTFPVNEIPRNRIIQKLEQIKTKRTQIVVDMGCGKAQIAQHFNNKNDPRFQFINYDHISIDPNLVNSCDISHTPLEDHSAEHAILCLSLWGSNWKEYIIEAHRILESNGKLYVIEPTKRWTKEDPDDENLNETQEPGGRLQTVLNQNGFKIVEQQIDKFGFFVCVKV